MHITHDNHAVQLMWAMVARKKTKSTTVLTTSPPCWVLAPNHQCKTTVMAV